MSQTQVNEIPDDEEPEVFYTCCNCNSDVTDQNYISQTVHTLQHGTEEWCSECVDNAATLCEDGNLWSDNRVVHAADTDRSYPIYHAREHLYYHAHSGEFYEDSDNAPDDPNSDGKAYGYHSTNTIELFGWPTETPKNSLCFGVELEMEHVNDDGDDVDSSDASAWHGELVNALGGRKGGKVVGKYLLMQDGSLGDSGVELITSPYTLDYHQSTFGWDKLLSPMRGIAKSGAGTQKCGMHVHVNRKALSALTLGKMLVFVNSPNNSALIERIAQRDGQRWAKRYEKSIKNGKDAYSDKYEALHLSEKTVEFRIFRGNLRPDRVLKNIEFCHSIAVYCKQAATSAVNTYSDYLQWLGKNRSTYPNLVSFLGERYGFKINKNSKTTEEV